MAARADPGGDLQDIVTPRRQRIHSRAADVLAARPSSRPFDIANHLFGAGTLRGGGAGLPPGAERPSDRRRSARQRPARAGPAPRRRSAAERGDRLPDRPRLRARGRARPAEGLLREGVEGAGGARRAASRGPATGSSSAAACGSARDPTSPGSSTNALATCSRPRGHPASWRWPTSGSPDCTRSSSTTRAASAPLDGGRDRRGAGADFERVYGLSFLALGYLDSGKHERGLRDHGRLLQGGVGEGLLAGRPERHLERHLVADPHDPGGLEERLERFASMPHTALVAGSQASCGSYVERVRGDLSCGPRRGRARPQPLRALRLHEDGLACRVQLAEVLDRARARTTRRAVLPAGLDEDRAPGHRLRRRRADPPELANSELPTRSRWRGEIADARRQPRPVPGADRDRGRGADRRRRARRGPRARRTRHRRPR